MKGSDLLVRCLEAEGVERVFGIAGEETLDVVESLRTSSLQLVVTRHEQAAGFMAATVGRLTGRAGVCLSTLGPGATNLVTAAAYAQLGAMPLFMLTGQKPVRTSIQGQFQMVDVVGMMRPLTKFTRQLASADRIPSSVREAFRLAEEERPGAAHLELPEDIAQHQSDLGPIHPGLARRPVAEEKALAAALSELSRARHPLVLIGAGANRKLTSRALFDFVERFELPFVTTQMGKGVVSDEHPMALGTCALSEGDYVHRAIEHADLIVNVGHDVVEKPPFFMRPGGTRVIHVNFRSAEVDPVYFPQTEVVGDIATTIATLTKRLERPACWDSSFFADVRAALRDEARREGARDGFPLDPRRVAAEVRAAVPDNGIVALDNGMFKIWFARNYPARQPNTVLLDNALASMGAGLPSAIAAKLVHPDRHVLAVCGDGGFMMNSAELATARHLGLDLVVLVLNDSALGMIRWKQAADGFADFGLDLQNPDFPAYARAYGATGHVIASADDLCPTLKAAFAAGGVHLVEVPVDYTRSNRFLDHDLGGAIQKLTPPTP